MKGDSYIYTLIYYCQNIAIHIVPVFCLNDKLRINVLQNMFCHHGHVSKCRINFLELQPCVQSNILSVGNYLIRWIHNFKCSTFFLFLLQNNRRVSCMFGSCWNNIRSSSNENSMMKSPKTKTMKKMQNNWKEIWESYT